MNKPQRAVLAAGAAVLLAVGAGTGATAATLITGKQIKDGTVTGADLKNGTVTSADIGDGSLTGTDIKNGSIGNADVNGGYYTRAQVDAKIPTTGELNISALSFRPLSATDQISVGSTACIRNTGLGNVLFAPVNLPVGAQMTRLVVRSIDNSLSGSSDLELISETGAIGSGTTAVANGGVPSSSPATFTVTLSSPEVVDRGESFYLRYDAPEGTAAFQLCGVAVAYSLP